MEPISRIESKELADETKKNHIIVRDDLGVINARGKSLYEMKFYLYLRGSSIE